MTTAHAYLQLIRKDPFLGPMLASYEDAACCARGKRVLDFGCGYGWGSYVLSPHCLQLTGYDPDRKRIQFARQIFSEKNIAFHGDLDSLPAQSYDMICLFMVLPCAKEPARLLTQIDPFLRPGGTLWISFKSDRIPPKAAPLCDADPKGRDLPALLGRWALQAGYTLLHSRQRYLSALENIQGSIYHKKDRDLFQNSKG